jgi:hypothetical protein
MLRSMKETAAAEEAPIKSLDEKIRELSDWRSALAAAPSAAPATYGANSRLPTKVKRRSGPLQSPPRPSEEANANPAGD